jgi:ribosome-associated protein
VVQVASEKQATDIVLLDVGGVASFADYFVLLSDFMPRHTEGSADSGWLLIDYGDVIVHIFAPLQRAYYQLDDLWHEAKPVVQIQ